MSTFSEIYAKGWYKAADMFVTQYKREGERFLKSIVLYQSIRNSLGEVYNQLVADHKCTPIEQLSEKDKWELFNEAKRLGATEKKSITQTCKALHALGSYLQLEK